MTNFRYHILFAAVLSALSCLISCSGEKPATREFPYVQAPSIVSSEDAAAKYISEHFWNRFFDTTEIWSSDSTITAGVSRKDLMDAFGKYVESSIVSGQKGVIKANSIMLKQLFAYTKASGDTFILGRFKEILNSCFYDPSSFLRNDEIIIPAYTEILESGLADEILASECAWTLSRASLNRVGEVATDFPYIDEKGGNGSMRSISSLYTLIFFNNPGCQACAQIMEYMKQAPTISEMMNRGDIKVLAMYIDREVEKWIKYTDELPKEWIKGYDPTFSLGDELYDLKAIPCIYVLDKEKKVLLKDPDIQAVEAYFQNL